MIEENLAEIFGNTKFITIATVCENGDPWATPIGWFAFDGENVVFDCRKGTVHAENLARDGRCFVTIVNYDQEHSRSVHIATTARKLVDDEYGRAKQLIIERGGKVTDDIFAAPVGEIDEEKSKTDEDERADGSLRFHYYMRRKA